jgi:uncharacterized protein YpuA (DUF1002 family)
MDNENQTVSVQDLIAHSWDQKPLEFQDTFNALMADKVVSAISNVKNEVAQAMFSSPEADAEVEDEDEVEDEIEDTEQDLEQEEPEDGPSA